MAAVATNKKSSYDFYLILATALVLAVISAICIYGMFYFKFAQVQVMPVPLKQAYMERMNQVVSPFLIALIVILAICVPKRLLPTTWLHRFALVLMLLVGGVAWRAGVVVALQVALCLTLALQFVVFCLALAGSQRLHFARKGYWLRLGSSALHMGLILFILDLFFHRQQTLHLLLFWFTTVTTVGGMLLCFYSPVLAERVGRLRNKPPAGVRQEGTPDEEQPGEEG